MDSECKGDRICEHGVCTAPAAAAPPARPPAAAPAPAAPAPGASAASTPATAPTTSTPALVAETQAPAAPEAPPMVRHSRGMMVGGIVMVSLAPVALLVSSIAAIGKGLCEIDYDRPSRCADNDPVIYGSLISAAALVGVGVPLIVIGAKKEPAQPKDLATIAPWATPAGGGLALRLNL